MLKTKLDEAKTALATLATSTGQWVSAKFTPIQKVWYRTSPTLNASGTSIKKVEIYGLYSGETVDKSTEGWTEFKFWGDDKTGWYISSDWINGYYQKDISPDERQILPLANATIVSSQNMLKNDYGY